MTIRAKTKRRLVILLVCVVGVAVAVSAFVALRMQRQRAWYLSQRTEGMALYERGEYEKSLLPLSLYVSRYRDDAEALYCFAMARKHVETADGRHVENAARLLQRSIELDPTRTSAWRELALLFTSAGMVTEAMTASERWLAVNPNDAEVQLVKARAHLQQRQFAEAGEILQSLVAADPLNYEAQELRLWVLAETNRRGEIVPEAQKLAEAHPADPRALLLMSIAYGVAGDFTTDAQRREHWQFAQQFDKDLSTIRGDLGGLAMPPPDRMAEALARIFARLAARQPHPDATFSKALFDHLQRRLGLPVEALASIEKASIPPDDAWVRSTLIPRLWEFQSYDRVDRLASQINLSALSPINVQTLGLRAIALARLNRAAEAEPILQRLEQQTRNPLALAWAAVVRDLHLDSAERRADRLRHVITAIQAAMQEQRNAPYPYLRYFRGDALLALGEREQAAEFYQQASSFAPYWAAPHARLARIHLERGQFKEAREHAMIASSLLPSAEMAIGYAVVAAASMPPDQLVSDPRVRYVVEEVQKASFGEENTFPIFVSILHKTDPARLREVMELILGPKATPGEALLLRLLAQSQALKLGFDDQIKAAIQQKYGMTPGLAVAEVTAVYTRLQAARANRDALAKSGADAAALQTADAQVASASQDLAKALAEFDELRQKKAVGSELAWRINWARLLELTGDGRAAAAWAQLADDPAYANDQTVQQLAFESPSVRGDRQLFQRVVGRLEEMNRDFGTGWRLARASLLLSDASGDAAEAVKLLREVLQLSPGHAQATDMLAVALARAGDISGSITQLETIVKANPGATAARIRLAALYQSRFDFPRALQQLEAIDTSSLSPQQRIQVAQLYRTQGDAARALQLIEGIPDQQIGEFGELLLAELYRDRGQNDAAAAVFEKLLKTPQAQEVMAAADFFASIGNEERAKQVLGMLDSLSLPPGARELLLAQFGARYQSAEAAADLYAAAVKANPRQAMAWIGLITQQFRLNKIEEAIASATAAAAALPDLQAAALFRDQAPLVRMAIERPGLAPLILAMLQADGAGRSTESAKAAVESLRLIDQAIRERHRVSDLIARLSPLADRNPRLIPLQLYLMQAHLAIGQSDAAVAIALRTQAADPASPDVALAATFVLSDAGQLTQALNMARRWRELTLRQPYQADLVIAELQLRRGDPAAALKQLAPYQQRAQAAPAENASLVALMVQALLRQKDLDAAAAVPGAALNTSAPLRELMMRQALSEGLAAETAAAWLDRMAALIPADEVLENLILADMWRTLGVRTSSKPYLQKAVAILDRLTASPRKDSRVFLAQGMLAEQTGRPRDAEQHYRQALQLEPANLIAANNLAMVLASGDGNLDEALRLARSVVEAQPKAATFHDTLAFVQARRGDFAGAIASLRTAVELEPGSLAWRLNLVQMCLDGARPDEARAVLDEVERLIVDRSRLPAEDRQRIADLRAKLTPPATTAASPG